MLAKIPIGRILTEGYLTVSTKASNIYPIDQQFLRIFATDIQMQNKLSTGTLSEAPL